MENEDEIYFKDCICPNCGKPVSLKCYNLYTKKMEKSGSYNFSKHTITATYNNKDFSLAICPSCKKLSILLGTKIIYPEIQKRNIIPNQDLNSNIQEDFKDALSIVDLSPRGACALLRLCIQKLMIQLGEKGKDINHDIGKLVEKGLSLRIQKALDIVRVIGNYAVHPGQIDLKDDLETALKLFNLINIIAYETITKDKELNKIYNEKLSEGQKKQIQKRDIKKTP